MVDFTRAAATAKRLIEKNGRTITIEKDDRTPADPLKPWLGPDDTGTTQTPKAAFVPPAGSGFGSLTNVDPTLAEQVTEFALVAATSLTSGTDLTTYDRIRDGAKVRRIVFVDTLKPADTVVMYALGLAG